MIALASIVFASYALILLWLAAGLIRLPRLRPAVSPPPSLSVIVAVRDEAGHLETCLEALSRQEYPGEWELFIIDDQSTDRSPEIARETAARYPGWHAAGNDFIGRWRSSKKGALETAFRCARGELLLFTDADCTPPPQWLAGMAAAMAPGSALCAGFSPLAAPDAPQLWRAFLQVDTLAAALVAAGGIGHGRGITCSGRNLACRRQILMELGGYDALPDTLSGDDDFLLQAVARFGSRLTYALASSTAVPAQGPSGWRAFIRQKRRHLSAGGRYHLPAQLGYALYHGTNLLLWASPLAGLIHRPLLLLLPAKLLLDGLLLRFWSSRLHQPFSLAGFLAWEPIFPLYHLIAFPRRGEEISWKTP